MSPVPGGAAPFYFQKIHPLNLPFALAISRFRPVRYWRRENVSEKYLSRFEQIDPSDYFTLESWQKTDEDAFTAWQSAFDLLKNNEAPPASEQNEGCAMRRLWYQRLSILFEERHLFFRLLERILVKQGVSGSVGAAPVDREARRIGADLRMPGDFHYVQLFARLDSLWLLVRLSGIAWRQISRLSRSSGTSLKSHATTLWTGISPAEIAGEDNQLDLAFLARRNLLDASQCVFLLPQDPKPAAEGRLAALGIRWIRSDRIGAMTWRHKLVAGLRITTAFIGGLACGLFSLRRLSTAVALCEGTPVLTLARSLAVKTYLTSVTACWPEQSEVALLGAAGIRTVNWSYGANTFCYSSENIHFHDLGIPRSLPCASEIWVWTEDVRDLLLARHLGSPTRIETIGPVMCGDARWCERSPADVRRHLGVEAPHAKIYISVFDVPPLSREGRLAVGHGPSNFPSGMLDQFFLDCERLLETFEEIALIVKPKRSLIDRFRDYPPAMERVLAGRSRFAREGRVILLPPNIDPYISVALAEISIGVPFTSPVLVARSCGRSGFFHDARKEVLHFRPKGFTRWMTHGFDELKSSVSLVLGTEAGHDWEDGDPAVAFSKALDRASTQL